MTNELAKQSIETLRQLESNLRQGVFAATEEGISEGKQQMGVLSLMLHGAVVDELNRRGVVMERLSAK